MSTTDERSRLEKLIAMATQDVSINERDNARAMLAAQGQWPPPPRPPAPPGCDIPPEPQEFGDGIVVVNWGTYDPAASTVYATSNSATYHVTRARAGGAWRRRFGNLGR